MQFKATVENQEEWRSEDVITLDEIKHFTQI